MVDWGQFEFEPDRPLVHQLGFNFEGVARLFTVTGPSIGPFDYTPPA